MTTLAEAAKAFKEARRNESLTQAELADRAGLARSTVTRLETLAQGDVGLSAFLRLLAAAGYDMKVVKAGHVRTLKDILAEQRAAAETSK
jgi:transcriptional regulator with XRE-family HTH domain